MQAERNACSAADGVVKYLCCGSSQEPINPAWRGCSTQNLRSLQIKIKEVSFLLLAIVPKILEILVAIVPSI